MSLRYASKMVYQESMRAVQGLKDQASRCDTAAIKSSSKQARRFSGTVNDSTTAPPLNNKDMKLAEESLRTVMYLSCWAAPN